jgi:hypothetical protein
MIEQEQGLPVYLEIGRRKTFACACDWPGWCRSARDDDAALQTLLAYGTRYARVLESTGLGFRVPSGLLALAVVERLEGNATTSFGAPAAVPAADRERVNEPDLARFRTLLQAGWLAFDQATAAATGGPLRKGPRGGGRDLATIVRHLFDADAAYLKKLGSAFAPEKAEAAEAALHRARQAILEALPAAARGELPARGPRGGARWPLRYFVRRVAWHTLDHAWEIEDRTL